MKLLFSEGDLIGYSYVSSASAWKLRHLAPYELNDKEQVAGYSVGEVIDVGVDYVVIAAPSPNNQNETSSYCYVHASQCWSIIRKEPLSFEPSPTGPENGMW